MSQPVIDHFNVDGQDYIIRAPMDAVPTQGSHKGVESGGVYTALGNISPVDAPAEGSGHAFSANGAFSFFNTGNSYEWLRKVFGKSIGIRWAQGTVSDGTDLGISPTYSTEDGLFFTLSSTSAPSRLYVSFNGKHWQPTDLEITYAGYLQVGAVIRFKDVYILSIYASTSPYGKIYWSDNGINWIESGFTGNVYSICTNGSVAVACGYNGIHYTEDGKNWSVCTNSGGGSYSDYQFFLAYDNGVFMLVSGGRYQPTVGISTDGKVFTGVTLDTSITVYGHGIAYGEGIWRAFFGANKVYRSTDNGASWTLETSAPSGTSDAILAYYGSAINYVHGRWYIVGDGGCAQTGTSTRYWVNPSVSKRIPGYPVQVVYMDGLFISCRDGISVSLDGYNFMCSELNVDLLSTAHFGYKPGILVYGSYYSSVDDLRCI